MIGWYTDNELSKKVLGAIPGLQLESIHDFTPSASNTGVFYGILRGCGNAMNALSMNAKDYYYIDNGYFDALYVDKNMHKSMDGKFRIVKNGMHHVYPNAAKEHVANAQKLLLLPPSPYSANFYDTTPEDWIASIVRDNSDKIIKIRDKKADSNLIDDLNWCDGVISFNSMSIMKAIEMGKPVMDTHGILRNYGKYPLGLMPVYALKDMRDFYEPKQFTLEEMRQGKVDWNVL